MGVFILERLMLFAATEKGYSVLKEICKHKKNCLATVISFNELNVKKNYFGFIRNFCFENKILFFNWDDIKDKVVDLVKYYNITVAFAIGWRYLLPLEMNDYMKSKLIVFHDSLLPKYRGFSPTPTAIICGEDELGMSVLYAEDDMDTGDIIIQKSFKLSDNLYIEDVIKILSKIYSETAIELINMIENNKIINAKKQDNSLATYSIWRDTEDCEINWNLSAKEIYNLIRAVSEPYTGAFTYMDNKKIFVWRAEIVDDKMFAIRYPGKIWSIDNNCPVVVCGKGMIRLLNVTDEYGNIIKFNKIRVRLKKRSY